MGRRPDPAAIITRLAGSQQAQQRLNLMLQTLTGQSPIPEAAARLGLGRSRLCLLRQEMLQAALEALEPKTRGRPPTENTPQEQQIAELQEQVLALKIDLKAAQIREELALLMPHLLHKKNPTKPAVKKNATDRGSRRRRGGPAAQPAPRPDPPSDRRSHEA